MRKCIKCNKEKLERKKTYVKDEKGEVIGVSGDDFYNFEEDSEIVDNIWDFFNETEQMTEKQIELIFKKDWENLAKII